ncbi:hypothetical protein SLS55_002944 [Diplodia seriata]|uniref:DNA repair protein rhp41 n=1 Tax=Diplodia seriata TaxID=420778 RepID=A0ABR3CLT0_9PEZI
MARAKAKVGKTTGTPRATRRSTRNKQLGDAPIDTVPNVFQEMLLETEADRAEDARPLKRRKVEDSANEPALHSATAIDRESSNGLEEDTPRLQTIIDESESDDSDVDWEDVDLDQQGADAVLPPLTKAQAEETLQIEIGNDGTKNKPARARRKTATAAERASSLKRFRSAQIIDRFTPDPNQSQNAASKSFTDGLVLAKEVWKKFKITSVGLRRAKWAYDPKELEVFKIPANADPVMDISDFRKAAVAFEGSPDTGAMLFCAFLRAVGVDARLICSLQPLPFAGAQPTPAPSTSDQGKDRDQVEDAELSRREAQEEMPKNVQDFKDHPYYVLERHLKHNEVIHPKRECGQVNVGTAAHTNLEPIYRRRDVHQLKSADKWYRLGREIKPGEQPLKHAKPRRSRQQRQPFDDDEGNEESDSSLGAALYAPFQTALYVPPPCVRGRVPRNAFGNLDVYVPSMVPAGGVHVCDARARHAARLLGVDHADAVTGFTFRGRHGTAVVEGVVVAAEYEDAMRAALDGLRDLQREEEEAKRGQEALRMWRRFLLGLRVVERVGEYASAEERKEKEKEVRERVEREEREEEERRREEEQRMMAEEMAGGFVLAEGAGEAPAQPTAGRMMAAAGYDEGEAEFYDGGEGGGGGGFLPDEGGEGEVPEAVNDDLSRSGVVDSAPVLQLGSSRGLAGSGDADEAPADGGGFVPKDRGGPASEDCGGFVPEDGGGFVPEYGGGFVPEDGGGFAPEDGGGFIPNEEDVGGGFVKEDTPPQPDTGHTSPEQQQSQQQQEDGAGASSPVGPVVPDAMDIHDDEMKQRLEPTENQNEAAQPVGAVAQEVAPALDTLPQRGDNGKQMDSRDDVQSSKAEAQSPEKVVGMAGDQKASRDDDEDSLPSHDPEDEDAEPEWLAEEVVSD